MDIGLARLRAAFNPALTARISEFEDAVVALREVPVRPITVAVVGLVPGAGRSTVAALAALAGAAYSPRRVVVVDAVLPGPGTVTGLLGGDVADGRIRRLLDDPEHPEHHGHPQRSGQSGRPRQSEPSARSGRFGRSGRAGWSGVPRRVIAEALTPGAAASVLSLARGAGDVTPQMLEQTLTRLRYRADLVIIDTPAGPAHPVLHAALDLADRFLLVVRGDRNPAAQVAAGLDWLASAPGLRRSRSASAVAVSRGLLASRTGPLASRTGMTAAGIGMTAAGMTAVGRDEALRRRRLDRISRRSAIAGLRLAALAARIPPDSPTTAA